MKETAAKQETVDEEIARGVELDNLSRHPKHIGNDGGVDGTRTRGLCRDRAAF
jgi:hypothetical protein